MSGTKIGGLHAAAQNKARYGDDYYKQIGAIGGSVSTGGGFGHGEAGRRRASKYGKLGGAASRRSGPGPKKPSMSELDKQKAHRALIAALKAKEITYTTYMERLQQL